MLQSSVAVNTATTYHNAVSCFLAFLSHYGFTVSYPFKAEQIVLFVAHCFEIGFAPSTISTYMAGLSFFHKMNNWYDPSELFIVKKLLEGCHRSRKRADNRAPVTPQILRAICNAIPQLCYNQYEASLFQAAYLLAYFGLFRVSELVHTDCRHFGRALQLSDVKFDVGHTAVILTIRCSKTNQSGQPESLRIPCEPDPGLCPVCALLRYFSLRSKVDGYLFQHQNGAPLTRGQFSAVLAKCIMHSPFRSSKILSHSFRIGRATELAAKGIAHDAIMQMGRWRSSSFQGYIRV
ncbi:MAG: tyrosine-type recombinase/integrase [Candidatus Thiodiazotropha sp.]